RSARHRREWDAHGQAAVGAQPLVLRWKAGYLGRPALAAPVRLDRDGDPPGHHRGQRSRHLPVDLSVGLDGTSEPFALLLESDPTIPIYSNMGRSVNSTFTLSLLDVTLPDGALLTEAGYDVTFASGMPSPEPVP